MRELILRKILLKETIISLESALNNDFFKLIDTLYIRILDDI